MFSGGIVFDGKSDLMDELKDFSDESLLLVKLGFG